MSTIEKALGLLDHFSASRPEIGLSKLTAITGVDKGTLHRHLTALRNCGFLEQNQATRAYRLGPAVIRLSAVREKTVPLIRTVGYHIDEIAGHVKELVHAALPESKGMSAIYAKDGGSHGTRVSFDEAEILPFHATASGIAMLAFGSEKQVNDVLSSHLTQFTAATTTSKDDILALVNEARKIGFACANQTFEAEIVSFAVPFFGHTGKAMGTLAVAAPASRMTPELRDNCIDHLIGASTKLCRDLNGSIPPNLKGIWAHRMNGDGYDKD